MLARPCTVPEATIRLASIALAGCNARQEPAMAACHFCEQCVLEGAEASAKLCRSAPLQAQRGRHGSGAAAEAGRPARAAPSAGPLPRDSAAQDLGGRYQEGQCPLSISDDVPYC